MKGWFPCMRKIKITADSSANLLDLNTIPFASAPLKVITAETEFVDDAHLDVSAMLDYFSNYKKKSKTSCPSPGDWLEALGTRMTFSVLPSPAAFPAAIMPPVSQSRCTKPNTKAPGSL